MGLSGFESELCVFKGFRSDCE